MNAPVASREITLAPVSMVMSRDIADEFSLSGSQWRVLVDQIFPNAKTQEAVAMALAYCKTRKLDVFKRPVHIVPMYSAALKKEVETVWPGISEVRTTAARTGEYAGIDEVIYGPEIEREFSAEKDKWENRQKVGSETVKKTVRYPKWASVVVYRWVKGEKAAFHTKIFWEETYATQGKLDVPNSMWAKRPYGQIDKCVEAAALRKAFPEELGNTYAAEEMEGRMIDHDMPERTAPTPPTPPRPPDPPMAKQAATIDVTARDVIDDAEIVRETGEDTAAITDSEFNATDFFEQMETSFAAETTVEGVEERFVEFDPLATFEGDDVNQGIALAIKRRALHRIGQGK